MNNAWLSLESKTTRKQLLKTCLCLRNFANLKGVAIDETVGRAKGPVTILSLTVEEDVVFSVRIYQAEGGQYLFNSLCTTLWNTISNKQETLAPAFLDRLPRVGITPPQILRSEAIPMGPPNLRGLGATKGDIANRRC